MQVNVRTNPQAGIAIGPILFIVAILAVLASAIAAGSGTFSGSTTSEALRVNASAMLDIGQNLKIGFDRLMGLETGYNSVVIGATNTVNAVDLFSPSGGGVNPPSTKVAKSGASWTYPYANIGALGGAGCTATTSKRVAVIEVTDATMCTQLNTYLGNGATPAVSGVGNPTTIAEATCLAIPAGLDGKMAGCYQSNTASYTGFYFYQVLGVR
ncbi:MAG: hypothetical protein IPI58_03955 [Alphaproteobacteria bacterium]|nr:MAG: hypothetical protein IPI58_03955 [Alphaproteobacteria bacterium]